ncbi:hypothetical protein ACWDSF_06460 [Nocardia beijingensis]
MPTELPPAVADDAPAAIAFLRCELSGSRTDADEKALHRYARRNGLRVAKVLKIEHGALDPTLRLINAVHAHRAQAVLIPQLSHLSSTRRAVTEVCELVAVQPEERKWPRGHRWPWH